MGKRRRGIRRTLRASVAIPGRLKTPQARTSDLNAGVSKILSDFAGITPKGDYGA